MLYTARINASSGLSADALEQIARTHGTVESITFATGANPCEPLKRDLVRRGDPGFDYPGFSVRVHKLFHGSAASGAAALNPSEEDADTTIRLKGHDIAVHWTGPKRGGRTARLSLARKGGEIAWADMQVKDNTKVPGFRPTFMHISGIGGKGDIIQVFDYYDAPPPLETITTDFSGVMSYTGLNEPSLQLQPNGPSGADSTASVDFPASYGPKYSYDSGWLPDSDRTSFPFEIRATGYAAANFSADVQGTIGLDNTVPSSPNLCLGSGSGFVSMDFGVGFALQGSVYVVIGCCHWWCFDICETIDETFDIYSFNFGFNPTNTFSSFLLGPCATATGELGPFNVATLSLCCCPPNFESGIACISGSVGAGLEGDATLCGQSITLTNGMSFTSAGQCNPLTTCSSGFHDIATYNESFDLSVTANLIPSVSLRAPNKTGCGIV